MSNRNFTVFYNGHGVEITGLEDNTFIAQISYKPLHIQLKKKEDGQQYWVEKETQQETFLTAEVGKLIAEQLCTA